MVNTLLTLVTKAPYGKEDAFAGLRYALSQIAAGVAEKSDTVLMEDGVYNALKGQQSEAIGMPSNCEATQDLLDMEGKVFCVRDDLTERELSEEHILDGIEYITRDGLPGLIQEYDVIVTY